MNDIRRYFRSRKRSIGLFLLWSVLFIIILVLSGISISDLAYPVSMGMVFLLFYVGYDFWGFYSKLRQLEKIKEHIDMSLENLPLPDTAVEEEYQALLEILMSAKRQNLLSMQQSQNELTEYVTIWTHQVKTPLTALQLLLNDMGEPQKSEMLSRLFEIDQYCDMMLQYLRLESDSTDYVLKSYSVKAMVNQAVKYFARMFISKGISVRVKIPEDCLIVTDEKWMVFVLKQLLSNALKYTHRGSVTIDMPEAETIRIRDTGIGIAAEDLPRIFERGYTGYNGRKDKKATGLGLFLVKNILTQLGGRILIHSEVDKGTEVLIVIPYKNVRLREEM